MAELVIVAVPLAVPAYGGEVAPGGLVRRINASPCGATKTLYPARILETKNTTFHFTRRTTLTQPVDEGDRP